VYQTTASKSALLPTLTNLRDFLNLLASLRDLSDPFGSMAGLQNAIELLINLGTTLGLDSRWLAWLQSIHDDPQLLNMVLAVGQYLENLLDPTQPPATAGINRPQTVRTETALAIDWNNVLTVVGELAQLLERLWPSL
jgi:hypothetical protein